MHEQHNNVWTRVAVMALAGGAISALLYTERGRESLQRFGDALDDFARSLQHLRGTIHKAGQVVAQGIDVAREGVDVVSHMVSREQARLGSANLR